MKTIPEEFAPTFFQELVVSEFEVRAFCFQNQFESIAIFSNYPEGFEISIDVRHKDDNVRRREVPFILPKNIEHKLLSVMSELKLQSGSFDLLVTKEFEFYFLEVNVHGQYGFVSI